MRTAAAASIIVCFVLLASCSADAPDAPDTPASGDWIITRTQVEVPGASLTVASGPVTNPCIVLGSAVLHERVFSEQFKRGLGCVFVDTRIHAAGASAPDGGFGVEALLADLDAVREELGFERVLLVGHSIYGLMALEYARAYPQHVSRVVAIAPPSDVGPDADARRREFWDSTASDARKAVHTRNTKGLEERLAGMDPEAAFEARFFANAARLWANAEFDATSILDGVTINVPLAEALLADAATLPDFASGPTIEIPVFLILGEYDFFVPHTSWDEARNAIRNLFFDILPASGHFPPLEVPQTFDERLVSWLNFVR